MVDETLLGEIFGAFGELISCRITQDAAGVHGYCDFADYQSARCAISAEIVRAAVYLAQRVVCQLLCEER